MRAVNIPCHPLSRRVIIATQGAEPVAINPKEVLYGTLAGYAIGTVNLRNRGLFTESITFLLPDDLAAYVEARKYEAAERLYRLDKERLAWYAFAQGRAKGRGAARPAVGDFLDLFEVDEDEYSIETAYKLFQRTGWEIAEKNGRFSGQLRAKSAAFLSRKRGRRAKTEQVYPALNWSPVDQQIELAVAQFMAAYQQRFRRIPKKLQKQARIYTYYTVQQLSIRDLGKKLSIPRMSVQNAVTAMRYRMQKNPTVRAIFAECTALPQAA